jgi:two-component system, OmpR family, heavy metal sensor histidine kinase CusS
MVAERIPAAFKTLRFRLMLWNAAVVLVTAVAVLVGLRSGAKLAVLHELDQILAEDIREIVLTIEETPQREAQSILEDLDRKARGHRHHGWFVQFLRGDEEVWTSPGAPTDRPATPAKFDLAPARVDDFRIVQHRLPESFLGATAVRVGASLGPLNEDMRRLDRLVFFAVCIVLVAAPLSGYWLAGRATRPLADLIDTAGRLRPGRLDERLPLRRTGDELDRLAHTFNDLLDRIAAYLRERRDFLANAAHELRSPLAAIRSTAEVALGADRSQEEYEELLSVVIDECESLEALVNQLLLLAETEAERLTMEREPLRWDEVVAQAVEIFETLAEERGVRLTLAPVAETTVEGNRSHLRRLMVNLLDNAIKFTPAGGEIAVALHREDAASQAVLSVVNTGPGIAPADLPHVFEPFYRGDKARTRDAAAGGTGLGLSICRAIAAAHGGRIAIASDPSSTTSVTVTLPLAANLLRSG